MENHGKPCFVWQQTTMCMCVDVFNALLMIISRCVKKSISNSTPREHEMHARFPWESGYWLFLNHVPWNPWEEFQRQHVCSPKDVHMVVSQVMGVAPNHPFFKGCSMIKTIGVAMRQTIQLWGYPTIRWFVASEASVRTPGFPWLWKVGDQEGPPEPRNE